MYYVVIPAISWNTSISSPPVGMFRLVGLTQFCVNEICGPALSEFRTSYSHADPLIN